MAKILHRLLALLYSHSLCVGTTFGAGRGIQQEPELASAPDYRDGPVEEKSGGESRGWQWYFEAFG